VEISKPEVKLTPDEFLALKFKKENCGDELGRDFCSLSAKIILNGDLNHLSTENIFQST
jgi:hypothetical protein